MRVLTASLDGTARLWTVAMENEIAVLAGHRGGLLRASFSPDGTRVVTASADNTARLWEAATGKEMAVLAGHKGAVLQAAFSPDGGRVATASDDRTARVWMRRRQRLPSWQAMRTLCGASISVPTVGAW